MDVPPDVPIPAAVVTIRSAQWGKPFVMSHLFLSYSKKDIAFARELRERLLAEGFAVWMDETKLVPSERWWKTIEQNAQLRR